MEKYLKLFISELENYLKQLNKLLLHLESKKYDLDSILETFRIFHTIKGMSQTMGFDTLADISHNVEDLLMDAKEKGTVGANLVDFLFTVIDFFAKSALALKDGEALPLPKDIIDATRKIREGRELRPAQEEMRTDAMGEIRVKMEKLDRLFNLTNELVFIKSRILKSAEEINNTELLDLSETASRLISSLQDEAIRLRMLPLSTVFDFFPRWFRDEAKRQRKDVSLEILGDEIEVDRSIIDVLKEPLLHLLRNALDHGIEINDARKKKQGRVVLKAERERDRIRISVSDNGKGIDLDFIRRKAVEKGLITERKEAQITTRDDLFRLLTHPDFSTKEVVTATSGRGIGLDIVNTAVVKIGGRLIITTKKDVGSCFALELPLSLAIVRAIVFNLDSQRFALPLNYVQEAFYTKEDMVKTMYHRELFPLRKEILPLIRTNDRLDCVGRTGRKAVIVVQYQGKRRGFITDEIIDEDEIVVKKLDPLLTTPLYSGCSIYTDGLPILILDPKGFE